MENKVSAELNAEEIDQILQQITDLEGLMPFLITLDKGEVVGELKLDKDALPYCYKAHSFAALKPTLFASVNNAEFKKDLDFLTAILPVYQRWLDVGNKIKKTLIRVGQESSGTFREIYKRGQLETRYDSSLQPYLDELTPYFKKFGKKGGSNGTPA